MTKWTGLMMVSILVLAGCGEPRIDGSSDEAFQSSIERVRASLEGSARARFDSLMAQAAIAAGMANALGMEAAVTPLATALDGLTGSQVLARADSTKLANAREELEELGSRAEEARRQREWLAVVAIDDVSMRNERIMGTLFTTFTVRVTNGSDAPISRMVIKVRLASPGRSIPWAEGDLYLSFAGGIEPGETVADESVMMGERAWAADEVPPDAVVEVISVESVFGVGDEPLYSAPDADVSEERMDELRETIRALGGQDRFEVP